MKKLLAVAFICCSIQAQAGGFQIMGTHCGTRGNFWGTILSDVLIPDYFPPENTLLRLFLVNPFLIDLSVCEESYAPVHLGQSCMEHDLCYRSLGADKDSCDIALLDNWLESCHKRYHDGSDDGDFCLDTCEFAADFMYDAMRYDDGVFCPSCEAFERDQKNAT